MNAPNELGWLRSVVRNVTRNMRRRRKVELQIVLSLDALKVDPGYIDKREQNFETLEACRALLTPEEFKVVKGVVVDRMPYVQVAQQMNISLWNCYKIKARAMAKLKKDLESVKKSMFHVQKEAGRLPDAKEKWSEFQQYYNTEERQGQFLYYEETNGESLAQKSGKKARVSNLRRYKRVLLAAALVALLAALIPIPAFGHRTVVQQLVACWTGEQFTFRSVDSAAESEIREEFVEVRDALEKRGVTEMTFPTYIPDNYILSEACLSASSRTGDIRFEAIYEENENYLFFDVFQSGELQEIIREKDGNDLEIYIVNGNKHYILQNNGSMVVIWHVESVNYLLDSSLPVSELKEIINSMYGSM